MPPDAAKTCRDILESASREFLQHGFAGASMRAIAAGAGVTTGALYRHFSDKTALFEALVSPVRDEVIRRFTAQTDEYIRLLETEGMEPMWEGSQWNIEAFVEYIYEHFDIFRLLFLSAEQASYENFMHTLIRLEVDSTLRYLAVAQKHGHNLRVPEEQEVHMMANAQFSVLFELVSHNIPRADGIRYADTMSRFFTAGWREVLLHNS